MTKKYNKYSKELKLRAVDMYIKGAKDIDRGLEYMYPHNYKNHYVKQQYLQESTKDSIYYTPQENKTKHK